MCTMCRTAPRLSAKWRIARVGSGLFVLSVYTEGAKRLEVRAWRERIRTLLAGLSEDDRRFVDATPFDSIDGQAEISKAA